MRRQARLRPEICVGKTRQRHERVHEIRMRFTPEPGVHSAHRRPHDEPRVIHAEAVCEQPKLRLDHVAVAVARKFCVHAVARLTRFPVTDAIGQNDEKFRRVERLARTKKLAGEFRADRIARRCRWSRA